MGARDVEGVDPADLAERVLRHAGVEAVGGERLRPAQQGEVIARHDQMQIGLFGADRAVAVHRLVALHRDAEADGAAVATAFVGVHLDVVAAAYFSSCEKRMFLRCIPSSTMSTPPLRSIHSRRWSRYSRTKWPERTSSGSI